MINWNTIPMVYNDSFTYMEWLGKLTYIADNHETRIDDCEKNTIDLWAKVNDHERRITKLEDWRHDTVDPFIVQTSFRLTVLEDWRTNTVDPFIASTTVTLRDHEKRITDAEDDIDDLQDWRDGTVTPFITNITNWKNTTVDPFITDIGQRMTTAEKDIAKTKADLTSERAERRNADNAINTKLKEVESIANQANAKVNRIDIDLQNVGKIRYFLDTATVSQVGGNTSLSVVLPDEDWVTVDVRFGLLVSNVIQEFRLSYVKDKQTNQIQLTQNGINFTLTYETATRTITATALNTAIVAADIYRFDYILYKGALTQAAQDQADIDFYNKMDANGDGRVDASDSSIVLSYYADAQAGVIPDELSGQEAWTWYCQNVKKYLNPDAFPDFNGDGRINASDASMLLSYYAYAATFSDSSMTGPQIMKQYRQNGKKDITHNN